MTDIRITDFNREFGSIEEHSEVKVDAFVANIERLVRAGLVVKVTDVTPGALEYLATRTRYKVRQTGPTTGEVSA
jgi:hypothetical protein